MNVEDENILNNLNELESKGLKDLFRSLFINAKKRKFFFYQPKSLAEKEKLDQLVNAGLIIITDSEFRIDNEGRVKVGEFIGEITDLGLTIGESFSI
jgi:hypothetical protein